MFRRLVIGGLLVAAAAMAATATAEVTPNKMCGKPAHVAVYDPNGNELAGETLYEPDGWADQYGHCPSGDIALGV